MKFSTQSTDQSRACMQRCSLTLQYQVYICRSMQTILSQKLKETRYKQPLNEEQNLETSSLIAFLTQKKLH